MSSLVMHVVGGRGPSSNVSFARRFLFRDVDEYTETCVHGAGAPNVASARHVSVSSSSLDLLALEFGHLRAGSKTHMVDASPCLEATADVALVGEFLGGAVGHDDEGNDKARKGGRDNDVSSGGSGPPVRPPQGKGHPTASDRGNFSFTTTSRLTGMVFRWLDWRTTT